MTKVTLLDRIDRWPRQEREGSTPLALHLWSQVTLVRGALLLVVFFVPDLVVLLEKPLFSQRSGLAAVCSCSLRLFDWPSPLRFALRQ